MRSPNPRPSRGFGFYRNNVKSQNSHSGQNFSIKLSISDTISDRISNTLIIQAESQQKLITQFKFYKIFAEKSLKKIK